MKKVLLTVNFILMQQQTRGLKNWFSKKWVYEFFRKKKVVQTKIFVCIVCEISCNPLD